MVQNTNLLIEARESTLDVEVENICELIKSINNMKWEKILTESKENAAKFEILAQFEVKRKFQNENAVEVYYQEIFLKIQSTMVASLQKRFLSISKICDDFKFLWTF